jgi:hypothetical protein
VDTVAITVNADDDAPTAEAGPDQTVDEGSTVTLDAGGSSDPEGQSLSYTWTQTGGPAATLSDTHAAQPTFVAPEGVANSTLTFQVEASDGTSTSVDTVAITVNADDDAPTANAGLDQSVDEGATVALDAGSSGDPEGQSLTYTWRQTGGPAVSLSDTDAARPTFVAPEGVANSTLTFQVEASDGTSTSVDTVAITVNADDDAPTANAGLDQSVDEGATVALDAGSSGDPEGQSLTYTWRQTGGPAVSLSDTDAARPTFVAPDVAEPATLTFEVTASDGQKSVTDTVAVVVNPVLAPVSASPQPQSPQPPPNPVDQADGSDETQSDSAADVDAQSKPVADADSDLPSDSSVVSVGEPDRPPLDQSMGNSAEHEGTGGSGNQTQERPERGEVHLAPETHDARGDLRNDNHPEAGGVPAEPSLDSALEGDGSRPTNPAFARPEDFAVLDPAEDLAGVVEMNDPHRDADDSMNGEAAHVGNGDPLAAWFEVQQVLEGDDGDTLTAHSGMALPEVPPGLSVTDIFEEITSRPLQPSGATTATWVSGGTMSEATAPMNSAGLRSRDVTGGTDELYDAASSGRTEETEHAEHDAYDPEASDGALGGAARAAGATTAASGGLFAYLWGVLRGLGGSTRSASDDDSRTDRQSRRS